MKKRIYYYHISCKISSAFYTLEGYYTRESIIEQQIPARNETHALMIYMDNFLKFNTMKTMRVFNSCLFCNKTDRYCYEDVDIQ